MQERLDRERLVLDACESLLHSPIDQHIRYAMCGTELGCDASRYSTKEVSIEALESAGEVLCISDYKDVVKERTLRTW